MERKRFSCSLVWTLYIVEKNAHPQTALATIGAIIVLERTDDLVVGIGNGKGAGKRASGGHDRDVFGITDRITPVTNSRKQK